MVQPASKRLVTEATLTTPGTPANNALVATMGNHLENDVVPLIGQAMASRQSRAIAPASGSPFAPTVVMHPEPLVTSSTIPAAGSVYWPFVLYVGAEPWALDDYYMLVTTDHGDGGIYLLTAPHPSGPWTPRGMIYNDSVLGGSTETAEAIKNPETGLYHVFYQQSDVGTGSQSTVVATTPDFVTFTRVGVALNSPPRAEVGSDGHTGYAYVWRQNGLWYAQSLFGGAGYSSRALWCSEDGLTFYPDRRVLGRSPSATVDRLAYSIGQRHYFWYNGQPFAAVFVSANGTSGGGGSGYPGIAAVTPDMRRVVGKVTPIPNALPWQSSNVRCTMPFVDTDGTAYIYVQTDSNIGIGVLT